MRLGWAHSLFESNCNTSSCLLMNLSSCKPTTLDLSRTFATNPSCCPAPFCSALPSGSCSRHTRPKRLWPTWAPTSNPSMRLSSPEGSAGSMGGMQGASRDLLYCHKVQFMHSRNWSTYLALERRSFTTSFNVRDTVASLRSRARTTSASMWPSGSPGTRPSKPMCNRLPMTPPNRGSIGSTCVEGCPASGGTVCGTQMIGGASWPLPSMACTMRLMDAT
mmetsp:Transcript_85206/g.260444  ORF Transcript_85206/g.260444 Transcript_85206/m.260444 type:complete len:220 (-) Transcript_85206:436-1095(-)